jgi:hypothetical protein
VAVARGNEKGRVERAIRYVREGFFAARDFDGLDDLNAQAGAWCLGQAADRPCPEDRALSVREAFAQERPRLLALPDNPFDTDERVAASVGKTPYARFDLNDYSIPHTHVRRTLTVVADPRRVRILDGAQVLAEHPRSYGKGEQVETAAHVVALVGHKRQARQHRATDRLAQAAPSSRELLAQAASRGHHMGSITRELSHLLDRYGAEELEAAIREAIGHGVPHPNAVRLALERRREARQLPPPVVADLSPQARQMDVTVRHHRLDTYDQLAGDPQTEADHGHD